MGRQLIPRLLRRTKPLFVFMHGYGVLLAATGFVTDLAGAGILLVILGALSVIFSTTSSTLLQSAAPNALRGQVMSFSVLFYMGTKPISAFLVGALSVEM
jgi:hypothetical protein